MDDSPDARPARGAHPLKRAMGRPMTSGMTPEDQTPVPDPQDLSFLFASRDDDLDRVMAAQDANTDTPGFMARVRQRPTLLVLPVLVGLLAGLAWGALRHPVYTAQARLAVARIDVPTQSLPGFAAGVQELAVTYSRLVSADAVIAEAARLLSETPTVVAPRVSASPIPQSPLFRIEATARTPEDAIATANAAGQALRTYVARLNSENPDTERLYGVYLLAARDNAEAQRAVLRAARLADGRNPSPVAARRLADARARAAGTALRQQSVRTLYEQSLAGTGSANVIQVVNPSREAGSDRTSTMLRLGVMGLGAGLLVGVLLVLLMPAAEPSGYRPLHART